MVDESIGITEISSLNPGEDTLIHKTHLPRMNNLSEVRRTKKQIIRSCVVIGVSFTLLFTGFNSLSVLQSSINEEKGLGTNALAVSKNIHYTRDFVNFKGWSFEKCFFSQKFIM